MMMGTYHKFRGTGEVAVVLRDCSASHKQSTALPRAQIQTPAQEDTDPDTSRTSDKA